MSSSKGSRVTRTPKAGGATEYRTQSGDWEPNPEDGLIFADEDAEAIKRANQTKYGTKGKFTYNTDPIPPDPEPQ